MPELTVHTMGGVQKVPFEKEQLLYNLIAHFPDAPLRLCGGGGRCGKCAVLAKGSLVPAPDSNGKVLACQSRISGDTEVWLVPRQVMTRIETRTPKRSGIFAPLEGEYASAVDIGTTTVVLRLLCLRDGKTLSTVGVENPQRMIAADVIGRIDNALHGELPLLHSLICEAVNHLETEAIRKAGLKITQADVRTVTGNTTMLYLYTGRNPESLSHAPFKADCLFGTRDGRNIIPPCMGAFVGADITCAVLSSGMCERNDTAMLIDIGTNGEIALWHNEKLICCATAAGPAFEGGGISQGVGSVPGAIDSVWAENGIIRSTTIDGAEPVGICGSGLIDAVATLLNTEILDETGAMDEDCALSKGVILTQKDIRQVQLAKGAIAAGIKTLVKSQNLQLKDIKSLYIAGGFGSHLNLNNAARIGLIPEELREKVRIIGNAALGGAEKLLLEKDAWKDAYSIANRSECMNLGGDSRFTDAFMEEMLFE